MIAAALAAAAVAAQSCDRGPACGGTAWYAVPSDAGRYVGYYVGGGSPFRGEPRRPDEGVWGWDYSGSRFTPRIMLLWNHGRFYQGGTGAYKTDGPRLTGQGKD